jgi:tryptophan synthase alpha chain
MGDAFTTAEQFRAESETPLLLMGYVNPVHKYGVRAFCRDAHNSGVDGLILPDLPPEESGMITGMAEEFGLDLVFLIAPNTSDGRIQAIDRRATGFVYAVSVTGLTGSKLDGAPTIDAYLKRARRLVTQNPLLVGFGIRSHADAMRLSEHTDGFIVGSALINHIEDLWDDDTLTADERLASVERFARALKYGDAAVDAASEADAAPSSAEAPSSA